MSLRIGIIGCGHMGKIHLEKLKSFEGIEVAGIVDINQTLGKNLSKKFDTPFFTSYHNLISIADGVIIATPTKHHYEIANEFLKHGSHVFIEKPITLDTREAQRLISLAKNNNLILQVGHLERFNPAFKKACTLITDPLFIDSLRISPFTGRSSDIDVILDLMIHDIDLILSLIKSKIVDIKANGIAFITDKIDIVHARIEFLNGSVAHLSASRISPVRRRILSIFEKKQYYIMDLLTGKLSMFQKGKEATINKKEYQSSIIDPVKEELSEFIRSIKNKKQPRVTGDDGLKALTVANRIKRYIEKNKSYTAF